VNKPYAFVIVFRSTKENEVKYYAIQPHRTEIETDLVEFLTGKLGPRSNAPTSRSRAVTRSSARA